MLVIRQKDPAYQHTKVAHEITPAAAPAPVPVVPVISHEKIHTGVNMLDTKEITFDDELEGANFGDVNNNADLNDTLFEKKTDELGDLGDFGDLVSDFGDNDMSLDTDMSLDKVKGRKSVAPVINDQFTHEINAALDNEHSSGLDFPEDLDLNHGQMEDHTVFKLDEDELEKGLFENTGVDELGEYDDDLDLRATKDALLESAKGRKLHSFSFSQSEAA